jgi:hypothetical protein
MEEAAEAAASSSFLLRSEPSGALHPQTTARLGIEWPRPRAVQASDQE